MLLPKKVDIDREKKLELKKEIDSGVALAQRIDKLRETKANEERALFVWRENTLKKIQKEIDDYLTVKENLRIQTEEAEVQRKRLIEPLDKEWEEINLKKKELEEKESELIIRENNLKQR